jgi:hypothetical protein
MVHHSPPKQLIQSWQVLVSLCEVLFEGLLGCFVVGGQRLHPLALPLDLEPSPQVT